VNQNLGSYFRPQREFSELWRNRHEDWLLASRPAAAKNETSVAYAVLLGFNDVEVVAMEISIFKFLFFILVGLSVFCLLAIATVFIVVVLKAVGLWLKSHLRIWKTRRA
jgi:hypothetical protein